MSYKVAILRSLSAICKNPIKIPYPNAAQGSRLTMGYSTRVGPATLAPYVSMSLIQALCWSRPLAERPMSFTPRAAKSPERRATSPSSVVQTGVKSSTAERRSTSREDPRCGNENVPGWEKRMAYVNVCQSMISSTRLPTDP